MRKVCSVMGDGSLIWMTEAEVRQDLEDGVRDAADRGKISELTEDEIQYLYDICTSRERIVSVERGQEIVTTTDSTGRFFFMAFAPIHIKAEAESWERGLCVDTYELSHIDYSYKQVKMILPNEQSTMESCQMDMTIPLLYGAMPNLGLYTKPDGPVDSWSELLPMGKIAEARASQEEAVEHALRDIVYVAGGMYEAGADGINMDTVGASGDADFLVGLMAAETLREKYPDFPIEMGGAGEFVLGMHADLYYDGVRLAGLYAHKQAELAQKAGVTIFGPAINTNCSMSFPWNIARVVTFVKACSQAVDIPIHVNVGMGVGGIPMTMNAPLEIVSRASKAIVEVGKADGL